MIYPILFFTQTFEQCVPYPPPPSFIYEIFNELWNSNLLPQRLFSKIMNDGMVDGQNWHIAPGQFQGKSWWHWSHPPLLPPLLLLLVLGPTQIFQTSNLPNFEKSKWLLCFNKNQSSCLKKCFYNFGHIWTKSLPNLEKTSLKPKHVQVWPIPSHYSLHPPEESDGKRK